eukprot:m51a1_g6808 hypothetical protein (783) ;mRNA; r:256090-258827
MLSATQQQYTALEPPAPLAPEQRAVIDNEDRLRRLYVEDPYNEELRDAHVALADVWAAPARFVFEAESEAERAVPKVLAATRRDQARNGQPSIVPRDAFLKNWKEFSLNVLDGLNWDNVFAAGGSVLACASADNAGGFRSSDIDLFVCGLTSESDANDKLRHIHEVVSRNLASQGLAAPEVVRTHRAVTILADYPARHVQVILRLYHSPAEVLLGFDVDCCSIGFDGDRLWATERFRHAHNKSRNVVNPTRFSGNYESRLLKYSKRGYAVAVPDLDKTRVDAELFYKPIKTLKGLARLLVYEYYRINPNRRNVSYSSALRRMLKVGRVSPWNVEEDLRDRLEEYASLETEHPSDYSEMFIPWGPQWSLATIMKVMQVRDRAQFFSGWRDKVRKARKESGGNAPRRNVQADHTHCFVSGIDGVISGEANEFWCQLCQENVPLHGNDQGRFVSGPLRWEKERVSFQDFENGRTRLLSGSFHPELPASFDEGVYVPYGKEQPKPHPLQEKVTSSAGTSVSNPFALSEASSMGRASTLPYCCQTCNMTLPSANALVRHLQEAHAESPKPPIPKPTAAADNEEYSVTCHAHVLRRSTDDNGWACDGRREPGGCRRGITGFGQTKGVPRYRCAKCDFDLCPECLAQWKAPSASPAPAAVPPSGAPLVCQPATQLASLFKAPAPGATTFGVVATAPSFVSQPVVVTGIAEQAKNLISGLQDKTSSLLVLLAFMWRSGKIDAETKGRVKDVLLTGEGPKHRLLVCSLEALRVNWDLDDFADTAIRIAWKN